LEGFEKVCGRHHPLTCIFFCNIALVYGHHGKPAEAEKLYKNALEGLEKSFTADHEFVILFVHNIGKFYRSQGRLVEAEKSFRRAVEGYEKTLISDGSSVQASASDAALEYATLLLRQGRIAEARSMYTRALRGYQTVYGTGSSRYQKLQELIRELESYPLRRQIFTRAMPLATSIVIVYWTLLGYLYLKRMEKAKVI
jgi:tetratricopeptide (TPR) repeat protein